MAQAKGAGCMVIGGIEMLIEQGLAQDRLWLQTDESPADAVRAAVYGKYRS